jgi:hypothetical protein
VGLVLVVLVAVAVHAERIATKETFFFDEPTSLLTATCHMDLYRTASAGAPPYGEAVTAADWQRFMQPASGGESGAFCPRTISEDMGTLDVHPPLYFWALNVWVNAAGEVELETGPALNVVFMVLTMLALAGLAFQVFKSWFAAALVAFLWGVGPASVELTAETRQYGMLSLTAVLFIWQAVRYADSRPNRRRRELVLLGLATLLGALTHYHFLLVIPAGLAIIAWRTKPAPPEARPPRTYRISGLAVTIDSSEFRGGARLIRAAWAGLAIAVGLIASYALHPYFFDAFGRASGAGVGPTEFWERADRSLGSLGTVLLGPDIANETGLEYVAGVALILVALFSVVYLARRRDSASPMAIAVLFVLIATPVVLLYVLERSPASAMSLKYFGFSAPFLLFVPLTLIIGLEKRLRWVIGVALAALFLGLGAATAHFSGPWEDATGGYRSPDPETVAGSDLLVIDYDGWAMIGRAVWDLPPDQPVLAADQRYLAESSDWVNEIGDDTAYLAILAFDSTAEQQERIAERIESSAGRPLRVVDPAVNYGQILRTDPSAAGEPAP